MALTTEDVANLARLARIELTEAELEVLAPQLDVILESVARVSEVAAQGTSRRPRAAAVERVPRGRVAAIAATRGNTGRRPGRRADAIPCAANPRGGGVSPQSPAPSEIIRLTAADLASKIKSRELSAVEVTQAHLDRIAEVDGEIHAFLYLDGRARWNPQRGSRCQDRSGRDRGSLAGVPLALKDILTYTGAPTTCGSKILEGWLPPTTRR